MLSLGMREMLVVESGLGFVYCDRFEINGTTTL